MHGRKPTKKSRRRRRKPISRSTKAELQFPVSRVDRHLREDRYAQRLSSSTPVFLAGVLEYLTSNILELAGEEADKNGKIRITPEHLQKAMENNEHLKDLLDSGSNPPAAEEPKSQEKQEEQEEEEEEEP
ncbi:histone H2A-Bbd type 1-like [Ochotona princeps]|uniref:histone H2A-Bbd type 1-like n=1 Tax=Ochotona princeps TaxID=9978 RepID=UPI002715382F|nr:histone H2A-Bbd type 1-like [Ochotona princeps]XP_004588026.2 histone H2A-Bbd type 1-like [Ochotona princeps]XP_058514844.1 histone H2A-Bbd type 1-like [Ochotona princeps]